MFRQQSIPNLSGGSAHGKPLAPKGIVVPLNRTASPIVDWGSNVNPVWGIFWVSFFLEAYAQSDLLVLMRSGLYCVAKGNHLALRTVEQGSLTAERLQFPPDPVDTF